VPTRRMPQGREERLQPTLKVVMPASVQCHRRRPRQPPSAAESVGSSVVPVKLPK
jgi:hypothetical protein